MTTPPGQIVLCAKSPWLPAIRREHAIARCAAAAGHRVVYVEPPEDVRSLRVVSQHLGWVSRAAVGEVTAYLSRLAGERPTASDVPGLRLARRTTLVPGHRGVIWRRVDCAGLAAQLRRIDPGAADTVVVNLPWHWPAASSLRGVRRVLDLADDWTRLIPHRRGTIASLYRRISAEADEIIVAAPELTGVLGGRPAVVVRNAASAEALAEPVRPAPGRRRLAYVGTLSERFDTSLVTEVLAGLPGWTLSLYGPCRYQGHGDRPDRELGALLHARASQVRWHGPVSRRDAVRVLDAADVLILPNNTALSVGQDPMKLYDYAARGRPIVSTTLPGPDAPRPPFLYERDTADSFAVAILAAADEPPDRVAGRRRWAESNSWSARLPLWLAAARGCPQTGESPGNGAATCTW